MGTQSRSVAGILLTGGASRRMGFDKATMAIEGEACAARVARALRAVVRPAVEVGPGVSGLPAVREEAPGEGPLAALAAGIGALGLVEAGYGALVLACDLPLVTESALAALAHWPGDGSVVPVVDGRPQPLCARWSAVDLAAVAGMVAAGERSMRPLLERPGVHLASEEHWPAGLDGKALCDADTPDELDRLRLDWRRPA